MDIHSGCNKGVLLFYARDVRGSKTADGAVFELSKRRLISLEQRRVLTSLLQSPPEGIQERFFGVEMQSLLVANE